MNSDASTRSVGARFVPMKYARVASTIRSSNCREAARVGECVHQRMSPLSRAQRVSRERHATPNACCARVNERTASTTEIDVRILHDKLPHICRKQGAPSCCSRIQLASSASSLYCTTCGTPINLPRYGPERSRGQATRVSVDHASNRDAPSQHSIDTAANGIGAELP